MPIWGSGSNRSNNNTAEGGKAECTYTFRPKRKLRPRKPSAEVLHRPKKSGRSNCKMTCLRQSLLRPSVTKSTLITRLWREISDHAKPRMEPPYPNASCRGRALYCQGPPRARPPQRGNRGRWRLRLFAKGGSHRMGLERPEQRRARDRAALNEARQQRETTWQKRKLRSRKPKTASGNGLRGSAAWKGPAPATPANMRLGKRPKHL